jgi:chemotaxis-related protein WspB
MMGTESAIRMSTRIIIVDLREDGASDGASHNIFGALAERVTRTLHLEETDFVDAGKIASGAPYAGPVFADDDGIIQRLVVSQLLPGVVRAKILQQCSSQT